jgi:hypothetical protein
MDWLILHPGAQNDSREALPPSLLCNILMYEVEVCSFQHGVHIDTLGIVDQPAM